MTTQRPEEMPPLALAYIGDAVYELYVREHLLHRSMKVHTLHRMAIRRVNNNTQANLLAKIEPELTEMELTIAKRGRNAKGAQVPKNANPITYRKSTGLEALVGYLYLKGDHDRLYWLLDQIESVTEEGAL